MYEFVKHYVEVIRPHYYPMVVCHRRTGMRCSSDRRKRISKTAIERAVKLRFRQAGVTRNVSPHRLRDVFLTAMTGYFGPQFGIRSGGALDGDYHRRLLPQGNRPSGRSHQQHVVTACTRTVAMRPTEIQEVNRD